MRRSTRTAIKNDVSARAISKRAIERARKTLCLHPHELLKYWANGVSIGGLTPDPDQQLAAAIASAPYYAPKLANLEVRQETHVKAVISAAPMSKEAWLSKYVTPPPALPTQNQNSGELPGVIDVTPPAPEPSSSIELNSQETSVTPQKD